MLLREVSEVAARANPAEPQAVSQRAFDRARASSPEHADLPAARQIAAELGLPWPAVLAVAHAPGDKQSNLFARKTRGASAPAGWLTDARIKYALRLVAGRLGPDTLTKDTYNAERAVLRAADARDWMHGGRLRLPSARAIQLAAGAWDAALRLAGLKASEQTHTIHQTILSRVEVMDRFYHHYHEQPSHKALKDFAHGNKIPMSGEDDRPWSETVAEWRQRRSERGLPEPRIVKRRLGPRVKAPDYSKDVGAAKPGEYLYRGKWADENLCVEWVTQYLASVGGRPSTAQDYETWARQRPGAPGYSRFVQHGGWEAIRRKAHERL
jgi:hypothetical protein